MTDETDALRVAVAKAIAQLSRPYPGAKDSVSLDDWIEEYWSDYTDHADAVITIIQADRTRQRNAGREEAASPVPIMVNQVSIEATVKMWFTRSRREPRRTPPPPRGPQRFPIGTGAAHGGGGSNGALLAGG